MSLFASSDTWPEAHKACGAPHQSPVNLSRSFALACDRLCELSIDKVAVPQGTAVLDSEHGLKLTFSDVKPTLKFNGEGYTCKEAYLFTPAQHTLENVRAEAEFVALFENPKGYTLAVSVPVRTAPGDTPSTGFFNRFVPYPSVPDEPIQVNLGTDWMLQDIVPEAKGYYVYEGAWVLPPCTAEVTWVVFANSVTIDPSDYAKLASRGISGNRPLQPVGDREVFFNDGETIESSYQKKDGRVYMRCRRVPKKGESTTDSGVRKSDVSMRADEAAAQAREMVTSNLGVRIGDTWASIGGVWGVLMILTLAYLTYNLFFSEKGGLLARSLFGFLMYIPSTVHAFLFGSSSTR
jgi:carbonic anhydrase